MSSGLDAGAAVLGGGVMKVEAYARFLADEYLAGYLPAGGGSVKLVVAGDADVADRFELALRDAAAAVSCPVVSVSAESTRVHMIDQVFFAMSPGTTTSTRESSTAASDESSSTACSTTTASPARCAERSCG